MYNKEDLFSQAMEGNNIKFEKISGISLINTGFKISKYLSKIEILNCSKSGDYYQELTEHEYNILYKNGQEKGCRLLALDNCKRKAELIQDKMKKEVNTRKNDKFIKNLKNKRDLIMQKYSYHSNKLTKLN